MTDIEAIRQRADAATLGPWTPYFTVHGDPYVLGHAEDDAPPAFPQAIVATVATAAADYGHADAEFIAHARTDIPALLAALDGERRHRADLEAENARLREALETRLDAYDAQGNPILPRGWTPVDAGRLDELEDLERQLGEAGCSPMSLSDSGSLSPARRSRTRRSA